MLTLELGDALLEAIEAASSEHGGGWVEYGLVERSYALANVDDWQALLSKYSHTRYRPAGAVRADQPYTASMRLGGALGTLRRQQRLSFRQGPGTGYWAYNNPSSYYAPLSVNPAAGTSTWSQSGHGVSEHVPAQRPTS